MRGGPALPDAITQKLHQDAAVCGTGNDSYHAYQLVQVL